MLEAKLIAFEGNECSGKSSAIASLKQWIEEVHGQECVAVKVPGGTPIGQDIRKIIVGEHNTEMSKTVNGLLFAADWCHTLETVVVPALKRGAVVLADRSNVTMYAYQHESEHLDVLMKMGDSIHPVDKVILITTGYSVYSQRIAARDPSLNNARDYITQDTFARYNANYEEYHLRHPEKTVWVNGENTKEDILLAVKYALRDNHVNEPIGGNY